MSCSTSRVPTGTTRCCFATNKYDQGWAKLDNPIPDADAICKDLTNSYGFQATCYQKQTRDEINATIRQFIDQTQFGPQSELLIYFAGHGYFDDTFSKGYVVATDSLFSERGGQAE